MKLRAYPHLADAMMTSIRKRISFLLPGILALGVMSCKEEQLDQAPEPVIKSAQIQYIESIEKNMTWGSGNTLNKPEGIIKLSFQFHDADNDLGFDWNGFTSGSVNYFLHTDDGKITPVSYSDTLLSDHSFPVRILTVPKSLSGKLVTVRTKKQFGYGTMPAYERYANAAYPYQLSHVIIRSQNKSIINDDQRPLQVFLSGQTFYVLSDTLYCQENPDASNLQVQFLEVKANGVVDEHNVRETFGASFNTRIPDVSGLEFGVRIQTGAVSVIGFSSSDGLIEYAMRSADFRKIFTGKKIRLRITVVDKAHHFSNIIESNDLQF